MPGFQLPLIITMHSCPLSNPLPPILFPSPFVFLYFSFFSFSFLSNICFCCFLYFSWFSCVIFVVHLFTAFFNISHFSYPPTRLFNLFFTFSSFPTHFTLPLHSFCLLFIFLSLFLSLPKSFLPSYLKIYKSSFKMGCGKPLVIVEKVSSLLNLQHLED